MAFIKSTGLFDLGNGFKISNINFDFSSENSSSSKLSPSIFGLDSSIDFVSGSIAEDSINISWDYVNPATNEVINAQNLSDLGFSGFLVNFYNSGRNFIFSDATPYVSNSLSYPVSFFYDNFARITGTQNLGNFNQFYID